MERNERKINTGKKGSGRKSPGKTALRIALIILGVLLLIGLIAGAVVLLKLAKMNNGATGIVPQVSTPAPIPTPEATLVPVIDPSELDLSEDHDPDIEPGDMTDDPIYSQNQIDPDVINIFMMGNDARDERDHGRTDSMMIVSYNKRTRKAKVVSLLRDTWIYIPGREKWNRLNTAYRFGGVGLAINTINTNFGLDVQYYMRVDFNALVSITDKLGGIDLELTEREVQYINNGCTSGEPLPERAGWHHLNGAQTLVHARNRKLGNGDWSRTERQRAVMMAFLRRAKQERDAKSLMSLVNELSNLVETNMTPFQLVSLAVDVVLGGELELESRALPFEGTWQYAWESGMAVIHIDIQKNKQLLHNYLYEG
ncbi:MAG: LCP family protein [Christensenellaceae bacterium]|nr:LCP family protein [Christensenellaceae bacterium]